MTLRPAILLVLASFLLSAAGASRTDEVLSSLIDAKSPGAAVLIRENGRLQMRCYGVADLHTFRKIDSHTNFRLASFSKQFTATAIMLLVHDGKLRYEQTLADIFPGFPAYGQAITVRHLLTHTSGLADYETLMGDSWSTAKQIHDEDVFTLLAQQTQGKFAPGTSWSYSNSGYVVLGLIVAKVSGMPYPEFLRRRIFAPLRMSHSVAYAKGQNVVQHRAFGYSKINGRWQDTDQSATSTTLGDGGIYSNLSDLARWDQALTKSRLVPATEMQAALQPAQLANGTEPHWPPANGDGDNLNPNQPVSYGFGWFLSPINGRKCMWHPGATSGFRTIIERFTDDNRTIIILLNRTDIDPKQLAQQIRP